MKVEISIDELVLRGVPEIDAPAVRAALQERLAQLAADPGTLTSRDVASHRARPVRAGSPAELGHHAAAAVWDAIGGGAR